MPDSIELSWDVDTTNTSLGGVAAATALGAVPLYTDPVTDPVLGQLLGLTVESDTAVPTGPSSARRTLRLNMTFAPPSGPSAPPPFPCAPLTTTPPVLPYRLVRTVTLPGSFFVSPGSAVVQTTAALAAELVPGDTVQFLAQTGVFYTVLLVTATTITLTAPYSGAPANTGAFKAIDAPATTVIAYSSALFLDYGQTGPVPFGPGARTVTLEYLDSTGAGPFSTTFAIPGPVPLAGGSQDIAEILNLEIDSAGAFGNNIGQITLVEVALPPNFTPPASPQTQAAIRALADQFLSFVTRPLVYLPPSYFALAQPQAATPALEGNFIVTTGSPDVRTTIDQTAALTPGDTIQFAAQEVRDTPLGQNPVIYEVAAVTPKTVTLTAPFLGLGPDNQSPQDTGTKGTKSNGISNFPTAARRVSPSPATTPSNAALSTVIAQFVAPATASPPPGPPFPPATIPTPTFLSGLFTRTLQLALAVPVVQQPIVLI